MTKHFSKSMNKFSIKTVFNAYKANITFKEYNETNGDNINSMVKSKLPPRSGCSLEAVKPIHKKGP